MAITLADFNKIWASTSPLTPYSFSESNYKQGWNFIGSTPPARQMWDFLQKQNDEKMQYLANNYLPLSGGTMTGTITEDTRIVMKRNVDDDAIIFYGGSDADKGASLILHGKDCINDNKNSFRLTAHDGTNSKFLQGNANGTLTWGGNFYPSGYSMDNNEIKYTLWEGGTTHNYIVYQAQLKGDSCHFIDVFIARSNGASSVACKLVLSCWNRSLPLFESFGDVLNGLSNTTIFAKVDNNYVLTVYMSTRTYDKGYFHGVSAGSADVIRTEIGHSVAEIPTGASTPTRRV